MNNDPLLANSYYQPGIMPNPNSYDSAQFNAKLEDLYRRKTAIEERANQPIIPPKPQSNIFDDIEREFEGLTDEQKISIYTDEEYKKLELEFAKMMQAEIIAFIRPRLLQNEAAVKLLNNQKDTVRLLKRKINMDGQKQIDEFKEYTEKYSDLTYSEYKKLVSERKG